MLSRRQFLQLAATASAVALPLQETKASDYANHSAKSDRLLLKPACLKPGAIVGIISPASATFIKEELDISRTTCIHKTSS